MLKTDTSYFSNEYTFTISGNSTLYSSYFDVITSNAIAVVEYLSDYVSWKGVLDFVVYFDGPVKFGPNGVFTYIEGNGLLPAYGGIASDGRTYAQYEAITGNDANGSDYDLGLYLLPNTNGTLTNYGNPLFFDPNPDAYSKPNIPSGTHDFFSIFLHEVLHGMAFWSTGQHSGFTNSAFDNLTVLKNGQYYFEGEAVKALLGESLPLATTGSRDHYGFNKNGSSPVDRGTVFEFGNYEQNRWHLGKVELAVLSDMGYVTANADYLPLVELPDSQFDLFSQRPVRDHSNTQDNSVLAGVVFADENGNGWYDLSEGLESVSVIAIGQAGTYATTTMPMGDYTLELPKGMYDVTFSTGGVQFSAVVSIETNDVKLDMNFSTGAALPLDPVGTVYRFYNSKTGAHFYTVDVVERETVRAYMPEFDYEGVAFQAQGNSEVYRFYNSETGAHFYTISKDERDQIIQTLPVFQFEGTSYAAFEAEAPGLVPLYRFYNAQSGAHFYTANEDEKQYVIDTFSAFAFEGVSYWVGIA